MKNRFLSFLLAMGLFSLSGTAQAETIWQKSAYAYEWSYAGYTEYTYASITFGVWPVANGHYAGVYYTTDGWRTTKIANAHWERNVQGSYGNWDEEWHWDNNYVYSRGETAPKCVIWYALFVQNAQGQRFWDNNNGWNYELRP